MSAVADGRAARRRLGGGGGRSWSRPGSSCRGSPGWSARRRSNHFFGVSAIADAFTAAFKIPNLMQNLLGEGVLSASFIPVYARLLEEGKDEEAGRVAGAVAGLLAAAAGTFTVLAVLLAAPLTTLIAPGFTGPKYELTVSLMRIITPGVAVLVLSAWCLGVLNSHRRFFLSYVAPGGVERRPDRDPGRRRDRPARRPARPRARRRWTPSARSCAPSAVGTVVGGVLQFARAAPVGPAARTAPAPQPATGHPRRAPRPAGARARGGGAGRGPAVRLRRPGARVAAGRGRHRRPAERPAAVPAADQPVRHVDRRRRAARDVPRTGRRRRAGRPARPRPVVDGLLRPAHGAGVPRGRRPRHRRAVLPRCLRATRRDPGVDHAGGLLPRPDGLHVLPAAAVGPVRRR